MNTNTDYFSKGIQFQSYIALNRFMDRQILKDSKLLTLMIYIAMRVKRSNKVEVSNWDGIKLDIGEFIIGRHSAVQNTDLTEMEYRSRIKKLQMKNIITNLIPTNRYTKGKWIENSFIDINLEESLNQPDNQQSTSGLTTNNNINKSNNPISLIIHSLNTNGTYSDSEYERVIGAYMHYKGIELRGEEINNPYSVIKKMFESQRTPDQIIQCMKWMKEYENNELYPWLRFWTISTVQKKLPEFIARKIHIRSWMDEIREV